MKRIHAYYEPILTLNQNEEFAKANLWKASWKSQGWEPTLLNRSHAAASPLYAKLIPLIHQSAPSLPPELQNMIPTIVARFSRWCALHAAGGGWMSDYDVVNLGFSVDHAESFEDTVRMNSKGPTWIVHCGKELVAPTLQHMLRQVLFEGPKLRTERDLAECQSLSKLDGQLFHVHSTPNASASVLMRELCEGGPSLEVPPEPAKKAKVKLKKREETGI